MDAEAVAIISNFDEDFKNFQANAKNSNIGRFLASKGVNDPTQLKAYTNGTAITSAKTKKLEGYCVIQYPNKTVYLGQVSNEERHGFGIRSYPGNKLAFVGNYQKDIKTGDGQLYMFEGGAAKKIFDGKWANDKRNGPGHAFKPEGEYAGNYVNDKMEGQGKMQWSNGDVYEGEFKQDLKDGRGMLRFANGDSYEGEFKGGLMHGQGQYTWRSGERYNGEFRDGEFRGNGQIDYGFNVIAKGNWEDSNRGINYNLTGEFGKY